MKLRPSRKAGLSVSLSKKFYQRSTIQTQQEIQQIEHENAIKKEMIMRMNKELENLQKFLQQGGLEKEIQKQKLQNKNQKNSPCSKTCKSPNKQSESKKFINLNSNQLNLSPKQKKLSSNQFARSQSACKPTRKRNSHRHSFASNTRNSKFSLNEEAIMISTAKEPLEVMSHQQLMTNSSKRLGSIKSKKDENYVKYLESRLRQLAKQVKLHNQAQLKIQRKTIGNSRRS